MLKFLPPLLLTLMCGMPHPAYAASPNHALGAWELCNDPDGDPKDVLLLEPDGTGKIVNADTRWYPLTHSGAGSSIMVVVHANGRTANIPLSISADKKQLIKPNLETGTHSTYVRRGNPDKFTCTAK
jgi:hypothetical protein